MTCRILIVDDDSDCRALCARLLRKNRNEDFLVTESADAAGALDTFSKNAFDCVLVDYRLPDGMGTDLIQALRQQTLCGVSMILLSAEDSDDIGNDACLAGASSYLPKSKMGGLGLVQAIQDTLHAAQPQDRQRADFRVQSCEIVNAC